MTRDFAADVAPVEAETLPALKRFAASEHERMKPRGNGALSQKLSASSASEALGCFEVLEVFSFFFELYSNLW